MPESLLQLIEHYSSAITNGHSSFGPWLIFICAVALTLSGIFASLRVPSDDSFEHDWSLSEMPAPTHAHTNADRALPRGVGDAAAIGGRNHVAGCPGSRCQGDL